MSRINPWIALISLLVSLPLASLAWANDDNWGKDPEPEAISRPNRPHWLAVGVGSFAMRVNQSDGTAPVLPWMGLSAEYVTDPKFTLFGHLGILYQGQTVSNTYGQTALDNIRSFGLGAGGNYYVVGTFDRGLRIGAQLLGISNKSSLTGYTAEGGGTGGGVHLGGRYIWPFGLTVDGDAGLEMMQISQFTHNANAPGEVANAWLLLPMVRAAVGWAF